MSAAAAPKDPTPFSKRLIGFDSRLVVDPTGLTLAVKDQLLMSVSAAPVGPKGFTPTVLGGRVLEYFNSRKVKAAPLTTVFEGLPNPGKVEDVAILNVTLPAGQTIFSFTDGLRKQVLSGTPAKASPNHVMIPAPNDFWCPHGPPSPLPQVPVPAPVGNEGVGVTVIDSGYIWSPPSPGAPWGPTGSATDNPLYDLTTSYPVREADWLQLTGTGATWQAGTPNIVDANRDGKLDALAGHANFVAGVVAQHCELPNVHIWNHNSAFSARTPFDNFSTEAAICRSLVMSQQDTPTPVIQIGHASPFLGNIASATWALAFARIGYKRNLREDLVLTCPAGNQGLLPAPLPTIPRFPAALHRAFPFVKGVASVNKLHKRSKWSNHGSWVVCSAIGENVQSSFLYVNMPVEDAAAVTNTGVSGSRNFKPNSWAIWNGTSFAAPKVAGEVAARISPSAHAAQAWQSLVSCVDCGTVPGLGIIFKF
jgi:hypothetical protein